jgi:hypothetical protein
MVADRDPNLSKISPGVAVVCLLYVVGAIASAIQTYFVWRVDPMMFGEELPNAGAALRVTILVLMLKIALFAIAASALLRLHEVGSVWLALATLLYSYPVSGLLLSTSNMILIGSPFEFRYPHDLISALDLVVGFGIAAYILLSKRIEAAYGVRTRRPILDSTAKTWNWLRGRHLYVD